MNGDAFKRAAPQLAELGEDRFESTGLCLPGMMWLSPKALDLLRDPRCVVHSTVSKKDGSEGDFKLYGRGVALLDLDARRRYGEALFAKIGWKAEEPELHVFAIDVASAGYVVFDQGRKSQTTWPLAPSP